MFSCRGRHRIYASTKRARRKMEKAAVAGIRRMGEQQNGESSGVWAAAASSVPSAASATADVLAATWDKATIGPRPHTESSASNVVDRLFVYQNTTYPTDSSSELAGALTLPISAAGASSSTPPVMHPTQPTAENNISRHSSSSEDDSESDSEFDDQEEHEVSATLQPASPREISSAAENADQGPSYTGPSRYCSVKGCKLVISSDYTFKMCPSCRTRYRTYGNTKRAKWKAEREAFDRELAGLRTKEDERRRQAGERVRMRLSYFFF
ncbi:hypothetical protein BDZ94DRAFT_1271440 [Collybia nuda]|uniref:Uncharacterized protein n=1 Tax=Collybia nuda TaxID=64659 RepID=A0A9P5XUV5_9AGAR|nr:hypothetical protein BDZ94DRAFT_1271440 [Collybia nuda]